MRPVKLTWLRHTLTAFVLLSAIVLTTMGPGSVAGHAGEADSGSGAPWVGTWAASPTLPFSTGISADGFQDQTVRQNLHISKGGGRFRLQVSNVFGEQPLTVTTTTVAEPRGEGGIKPGSATPVTFGGAGSVTVPAGESVASDTIRRRFDADSDVTVSMYFAGSTGPTTWHRLATSTSYISERGDQTSTPSAKPFTTTASSFFFVTGLDVTASPRSGSVVTLGASITDGVGSTLDANRRYPDVLARRLGGEVGVLNAGIGANQVINDTEYGSIGALGRFERDALDQPGVRDIILLEGTNDILGAHYFPEDAPTLDEITAAYEELTDRAHKRGIRVLGATIPPFGGTEEYTPERDETRRALNDWIREESTFDGIVDADELWHDPANPHLLKPVYDSGDGLHPNDAGYSALAHAIDLDCLTPDGRTPVISGAREDCTR